MSREKQQTGGGPAIESRRGKPKWFWGIFCVALTIFTVLAIVDYRPSQNPRYSTPQASAAEAEGEEETAAAPESNIVGKLGVWLAYISLYLVGVGAWILPFYMGWYAYMFLTGRSEMLSKFKNSMVAAVFFSLSILASLVQTSFMAPQSTEKTIIDEDGNETVVPESWATNYMPNEAGGWIGKVFYRGLLKDGVGKAGTSILFGTLLLVGLMFSLSDFRIIKNKIKDLFKKKEGEEEKPKKKKKEKKPAPAAARPAPMQPMRSSPPAESAPAKKSFSLPRKESSAPPSKKEKLPEYRAPALLGDEEPPISDDLEAWAAALAEEEEKKPGLKLGLKSSEETREREEEKTELKIVEPEKVKKASARQPEKKDGYTFPGNDLLETPPEAPPEQAENIQETADALLRTLKEFKVDAKMGEVHVGPVITRYDVHPAAGVRVEKILNLDKNLALALKAISVRILAPVPGKGCVGIEVPNKNAQSVFLRDILESEDWANTEAEIPIALGKRVNGKPLVADLAKMPHMLIAGATGSGKTVCLNSVIASLIYKFSPEELRMVMIDPKIVEMQVYNTLPHMLIPVVTDAKKVPSALRHLLNEMEGRYQKFAKIGVRNITGYNAKIGKDAEGEEKAKEKDAALSPEERAAMASAASTETPGEQEAQNGQKLPYIICIVDELADLMMVAPADIEAGIARLAQLARAAGIHLIISTQRPSVNVITGVIKANLPSRISFKVASKVDSRTILDTGGADQLIGRGDLLFLPPGASDLVRAQGAYIADEEIHEVVEFLKQNGEPEFDEEFQKNVEEGIDTQEESGGGEEGDELLPDAIEVLRTTKRASTSMLQRRLRIGYNRAARIMEILEAKGVVGPENGSAPREILVDLETFKL